MDNKIFAHMIYIIKYEHAFQLLNIRAYSRKDTIFATFFCFHP
jgi:hypothetical protein